MAVDELTNSVTGNGNGSARTFSFSPVVISKSSDLVVVKKDINGVETPLSEGTTSTTYSVSVSGYPGTGSIDYPASGGTLLVTGESVTMRSVRELTQPVDLENQGGYFADTQETMHDKHTYIDQQQQVELDRSIKIPVSDGALDTVLPTKTVRALKALIFDANGDVAVGATPSTAVQPVDETSSDTTKNKTVSNFLAKGWERTRNQSYGVVRMINTVQSNLFNGGPAATWVVYKEDGSVLDVTGTTTKGLQEAINYAADNGYDLEVNGGGTRPIKPQPYGGALGTDPFATVNTSNVVTVTHASHGYSTGQGTKLYGLVGDINGIPQAEFNAYKPVTVIDPNSYTITMTSAATSTGSTGGSSIRYQDKGINGAVITCTTTVNWPPMQGKVITFHSTTINSIGGPGTDFAHKFDSLMGLSLIATGCQWVVENDDFIGGFLFAPTNELPHDIDGPVMTACDIRLGGVPSFSTLGPAVRFDTTNGAIIGNFFEFVEIAAGQTGLTGLEIIGSATRTFQRNHIRCCNIHTFTTACAKIGTSATGTQNIRNNYFNLSLDPADTKVGLEVWGRGNIIDLQVSDDDVLAGDWLQLKSSADSNIIRLSGMRQFKPKITDSSNKSNSIITNGRIASSVHRNNVNQTGVVTNTWTKVEFDAERYDAGAGWDASPNYRWTPGVIGMARINASVNWVTSVAGSNLSIAIYKNGTELFSRHAKAEDTSSQQGPSIDAHVEISASTDYFEIFVRQVTGSNKDISGDANETYAMFERIN